MAHPNTENTVLVGKEPTAATQRLLRLMRTGATDRAIARELGVSLRTLHRRIARLQSLLGVQSRFQLGVLAAELEWLAVSPPSQVGRG
jgi:DNA-binding NarL/FixJ family response regulator